MQWAAENLPNQTLYSLGDDDVLVNLTGLQLLVEETMIHFSNKSVSPIICVYGGRVNSRACRKLKSKNYISEKEYASKFYPRYCLGGYYTTNVETVAKLYAKSKMEPLLPVDDVWITGILRKKPNISDDAIVIHDKKGIATHKKGKLQ